MNSYTFMGLDDVEEGEEISSRKKSFIKRAIAFIKIRRQANRVTRNDITRDRAGAHEQDIFPLIKCTSAIRQLKYGVNASFLDEYMQISERSSRMALDHFCEAFIDIYGPKYLRKPTEWFGCPYAFKGQYVRRDHGLNPFILLEVVASQDLWIWHVFFGVVGSNNDINVLYQSPLFNDLKTGRASKIPFVANGVSYPSGYYLVDGIYPELAPLVKTIPEPAGDDHKRILYKKKQESTRKDVERAFSVLKKK
ncbi:ALP1-like protein isoform X1 [Tanacetum coccineum]